MLRQIGRYSITAELGKGGFGYVYKAHDPLVGRDVAIKILTKQDDPSMVARFRSEATTAGNLHHKNIVTIHEFGEDQGMPFLVMEFLNGIELNHIIARGTPLSLLERVEFMVEVAEGLQFAHEHGVVHRDVKPANIMRLTNGTAKIMDFGIARLLRDSRSRLTQTGSMIGTIQYMAPEQFRAAEPDALSDIWSYGVVFYEFLTGVQPFNAPEPSAIMYRVINEEPAPMRSLLPECPPELEALVHRLLTKNSNQRPQSLEDILFDAQPILKELTRTQLPELIESARQLIEAGEFDQARTGVRRILSLDPSNSVAHAWREGLREFARRKAARPQIEGLLARAEQQLAHRNFKSAIGNVESALKLDPKSPTLLERLSELRTREEKALIANNLVKEAREQLAFGNLTGAFQFASEAVSTDPQNSEALTLLEAIQTAIAEQRKQASLRADLDKAEGLLVMQAYDEAIGLLSVLAEKSSGPEVMARLAEARELKKAEAVRQKVTAGIQDGKILLKQGQNERAVALLEELSALKPDEPSLQELLSYARDQVLAARKSSEIDRLTAETLATCQRKDFKGAFAIIDQALKLYPYDERLLRVQQTVADEQRAERQRQEIALELERVRALSAEKPEEALRILDRLAAEHPDIPAVSTARKEVVQQIQDRQARRQQGIQKGLRDAEKLLKTDRAESATRLLQEMTVQFPDDGSVRALLEKAQAAERVRTNRLRVDAARSRAQGLAGQGKWDEAIAALERELSDDPECAPLREDLAQISRQKTIEEAVAAAEAELSRQNVDRAIKLAETANRIYPGEARIAAVLAKALERKELHRLLRDASTCLATGNLEKAKEHVGKGLVLFGGVKEFHDLAEKIDQARTRQKTLAEAQQALEARNFDKAHRIAKEIAAADSGDSAARLLIEQIEKQRSEHERNQAYQQARSEAARFLKQLDFDRAIGILERLTEQFPEGQKLVQEELERARASREQHKRKLTCDAGVREAQSWLNQGRFDDAIASFKELIQQFPENPALPENLQAALSALQLHEQRRKMESEISVLEQHFHRGEAEKVREGAKKILSAGDEPRARELLRWAEESLSQAKKIRKESRVGGDRRKVLWISALGMAALIAIGAMVSHYTGQQKQLGNLQVKPGELRFQYQKGNPLPGGQSFSIDTPGAAADWLISSTEPWLTLAPLSGTGSTSVAVTVNPTLLEPGEYSELVTVSLGNSNEFKTMRVRLRVAAPSLPTDSGKAISDNRQSTQKGDTKGSSTGKAGGASKSDSGKADSGNIESGKADTGKADSGKADSGKFDSGKEIKTGTEQPVYPSPGPVVDCSDKNYRGRPTGTITWSGQLPPNELLAFGRGNEVLRGAGRINEQRGLPGCAVSVTIVQPSTGMVPEESPTASNNFGRIVLRNTSGAPINSVRLRWEVR